MVTQKRSLTIFEIINERRREIYVGATRIPIFRLVGELKARRPAEIKHWDLSEATTIRSVEFGLDQGEARAFIDRYVGTALPPGWRYLRQP